MEYEFLAGGGLAIVIALISIRFFIDRMKRLDNLIMNHIKHNTEVLATQIETNKQLVKQQENTEYCIHTNTNALAIQSATNRDLAEAVKELTTLIRVKM